MNTFRSYLLPPYSRESANDADEMKALFEHSQTPLPDEPTCIDLTPSHLESALPIKLTRAPTNPRNPMSMFHASKGVTAVWDHFLQNNAQGRNGNLHVGDYYVIRAVSPYFMLRPTDPSAWFTPGPGIAGKEDPSGMSRLVTGTPLRLEDLSVCVNTNAAEFHVYHCILGLPFLRQGGYTFFHSDPHVFTRDTIPRAEDPISTIIAIPDYLAAEAGRHLDIEPNTFNQIMVPGYPNLAKPPRRVWEYMEEEEPKKQEVKFDWFTSNEDEIRKEAARLMEERKLGSG
jgi:hypothetical protein